MITMQNGKYNARGLRSLYLPEDATPKNYSNPITICSNSDGGQRALLRILLR